MTNSATIPNYNAPPLSYASPPTSYSNYKVQNGNTLTDASNAVKMRAEMQKMGQEGASKVLDKERYKQILMKYDMERDGRLAQAEQLFMESQKRRPEERISQKQYQEMKIRIEWDVAWRIFDHVNENNDTDSVIDLNCLDIDEA